jgi:hypothetical protein
MDTAWCLKMAEIFGQKVLKEIQPKTSNPNRVLKKVQS